MPDDEAMQTLRDKLERYADSNVNLLAFPEVLAVLEGMSGNAPATAPTLDGVSPEKGTVDAG